NVLRDRLSTRRARAISGDPRCAWRRLDAGGRAARRARAVEPGAGAARHGGRRRRFPAEPARPLSGLGGRRELRHALASRQRRAVQRLAAWARRLRLLERWAPCPSERAPALPRPLCRAPPRP